MSGIVSEEQMRLGILEGKISQFNNQLTLRDQFAMAALPAIIDAVLATEPNGNSAEQCARLSYAMANAMLEARK